MRPCISLGSRLQLQNLSSHTCGSLVYTKLFQHSDAKRVPSVFVYVYIYMGVFHNHVSTCTITIDILLRQSIAMLTLGRWVVAYNTGRCNTYAELSAGDFSSA